MSEDNSAKPLRQHRFKITSKKTPSQSQIKASVLADVADVAVKSADTLQQSVQPCEGINIQHKRIRSESRPRLFEHQDDTIRGRNQNVGNPQTMPGDARTEKFRHRRSKSSVDGFYSQNNTERVIQRSLSFNKGAILDAVLQHGFEKTVNFTNSRKKLEESIIHVIRGGDTFYNYPISDEFVVTNTKNIGSLKKQEVEEKKPIPLNRHRSPTQNVPFINSDADAAKSRTMSEPPRFRGRGGEKESDRESGERLRHEELLPCSFDDRNDEENEPDISRPHKKSRGKRKKKSGSSQPFLSSPKSNSMSGGSRHSLASDSLHNIRSPPNSYRIHAKNASISKEDGATKGTKDQHAESESHPNFKFRGSQKSFRKWQPNDSSFEEAQGVVDVVSDRKLADSSPGDRNNKPCDCSLKEKNSSDRSPRETKKLSRSPGETTLSERSPRNKTISQRSPRNKTISQRSPRDKKSQGSVNERSTQSPPRMSKKSNTCLKTCEKHIDSPRDSCKSDHHKSNVICESSTKKELSSLSTDQKCDLSMSTANRKTSPNCQGKEKTKGKKKDTSPRAQACMPGFRYKKRCPRRLSLNRQNFFGSLAQAVGKELNSIAYRNSLFHSFPGMVGLYRPDIGMDSLFVTPSSVEPSEAEEEIDDNVRETGTKKKRKDDDDTSRQVSSDEKLVSDRDTPKTKGKSQQSTKKAAPAKAASPVKTKKADVGSKNVEIKKYQHAIENKQVRHIATSPQEFSIEHADYSSSSAEALTLHADHVESSKTETPIQPRLLRRFSADPVYAPTPDGFGENIGYFVPESKISELVETKEHMSEENLYVSQMSQIKSSISDSRRNSTTPVLSVDSSRQSFRISETPVPEIRKSTMKREDRCSITVRNRESNTQQEQADIGRKSVYDYHESCPPLTSRGDSRLSAKQDELIFVAPMTLRNTYQKEVELLSRKGKTDDEAIPFLSGLTRTELLSQCPITRQDHTLIQTHPQTSPSTRLYQQPHVSLEHIPTKTMRKVADDSRFTICNYEAQVIRQDILYQSDVHIGAHQAKERTSDVCLAESATGLQQPYSEVCRQDSRRNLQRRSFSKLGPIESDVRDGQYEEIANDYKIENLSSEMKRKSDVCQDVFRADRRESEHSDVCKAVDSVYLKNSYQEKRMIEPMFSRPTSDRIIEDTSLCDPFKEIVDEDSSSHTLSENVSFTNVRQSSVSCIHSNQEDCPDIKVKRTSLKESIKEEFRMCPEDIEHTTVIASSRAPITTNKSGDTFIRQFQIVAEDHEVMQTECLPFSPTGNSLVQIDFTPSKECDKEVCSIYRHDLNSQQESDKPSRRTSSAKRSPTKSEQRLCSTRHMSQDDCIRPCVEERSSRDQCRSRKATSLMDPIPKEFEIERRKSNKYDEQNSLWKSDKGEVHNDGVISDASENTSTWKQSCSEASEEQLKHCAPTSRKLTKRDSAREKTKRQRLDDPPSLVTYDSTKQISELSIVDNECSCTNADATEDDLTISMPSRGSKQFSQVFNKRSSGDDYGKNKEMAGEEQRTCKSRLDDRYLKVKLKKEESYNDESDVATSSSDDETYQNDSRLEYDSGAYVAAGDMCPQGQLRKIRGRITFRSNHDKKSPSGTKVLTGSVKTSPKDIQYDSCSTENSEFTERGYIPKKRRSNSMSSSKDNMAKYIRDSEYIRERQLRLLEYEQNHTQSCDPGSYNSLVTGHHSPIPAPRSNRKGCSFDELTSDTADSSESVNYERELQARQIYKSYFRSHSNTSRLEYKRANVQAKIIDSFIQVITPEQPSAINDQRSSKSKCDYITQVLRSPDSPYQKPKDKFIPTVAKELLSDAGIARSKYMQTSTSKKNNMPSDYNRNKNSPLSKRSASCQHRENPFLDVKSEFIPYEDEDKAQSTDIFRKKKTFLRPLLETKCNSEDFDADKEKSIVSSSGAGSVDYRQESGLFQGYFIPESDCTEYMGSSTDTSTLLTIAKNKNCSSNTERDRNSSSGGGDFLYSDFAYHCGVIDTLRLLDFDNVSSTPSTKLSLADVVDDISDVPRKMSFSSVLNNDNLAEIARSIPSVGTENEDKAIELVRQNSIRALLFAASMSNSWTPFRIFPSSSGSTKETAKWVQELKNTTSDKKDSEYFVSSSSQEFMRDYYLKDSDKKSDETFENTMTFDLEPKHSTEDPKLATEFCKCSNDALEKSTAVASNNAFTANKNTSPVECITSEIKVDKRKTTTITCVDFGANTESQGPTITCVDFGANTESQGPRKNGKTKTRGVEIRKNAAIQTINIKEKVEKCDKSENTEIQYFVRDAQLNTKIAKQSQMDKSKFVDGRQSYSAPDSKEHSSLKSHRKSTREYQSFKTVKSDDRIMNNKNVITELSKSKPKYHKKEINTSDYTIRKIQKITPRERSRSLESITLKRKSCSPLERRRNKQCSRVRERDTSQSRGEQDSEKLKSHSSNRSNKYENANCSPSSSPSPDFQSYPRHMSNKHSWYEDYKPSTATSGSRLEGQTKVYSFEKSKSVCSCPRCQKRRRYLKRYINARRKCNNGKKEVIVLKSSRRYMGACGDVSTNNKTENNCKRCLSEDRSLLDNIAIFVVASQTTLADNSGKEFIYPTDVSIQPELLQKVIEKARFACSNNLENVHILTLNDSDSQVSESPTIEDLGQFTSWKSDTNVPWKRDHEGKGSIIKRTKSHSPSEAILDLKSSFTRKGKEKSVDANVSDLEESHRKRSARCCGLIKGFKFINSNKDCLSPRKLRDKKSSVARDNKSNSAKWDLQCDTIDSDGSISNFRPTASVKYPENQGNTASMKRRCDDYLRGEGESVPIKNAIPKSVSPFQITSTSKWKDTYLDATDFQASTVVFNSSRSSRSENIDTILSRHNMPGRGHNSHQFEPEDETNDRFQCRGAVDSSVDPCDQKAVQTSPLRFIQSIIDGQVKVLLEKAIQNWTSPMLSKPSIFTHESSSVDSPEKNKVVRNSQIDSPDLVISCVHPMGNSMLKTKEKTTAVFQDQSQLKFTSSAPYCNVEDYTKTKSHNENIPKTPERKKKSHCVAISGDNETKTEKSLLETKSKSSISSKALSNTDVSYHSVSDTDISSTKDQNASKLHINNRQTACLERSLKKSSCRITPPQKTKRKRRKSESRAENCKSSRLSCKSPSRSRERTNLKSPITETNVKSLMPGPRQSPTTMSKEVKLNKLDVKNEKPQIPITEKPNKEQAIPKVKLFSECGVSRIANKLIAEARTAVCSLGVTSSSTEDIKQRILIGCRHFDKHTLERRVMEELMEQKLNALQLTEDAGANMDADSLAGCEGIESCLLTPIMEESQTTHDKSKNDFDSFVSECKEKLKDIICKSKGSANDTLSNVSNKSHSSSAAKNIENPCQAKDDTDADNSYDLKSSSSVKVIAAESTQPMLNGYCDSTNRNNKDSLALPMQLKGPYKSAFLRNEMSSTFEGCDPFIKENKLISQYSVKKFCARHQQQNSNDWLADKIHEDLNFSKSKFGDNLDSRRNFTASTYPSAINYRFSLTESHYKSSYMRNTPRNYNDVSATTSQLYGHRHSIFSSATTDYCVERAQWFPNEHPRGNRLYTDIANRNRNESANNGSDSSSSESSGVDDVLNADGADEFSGIAKRANVNMYYPNDKLMSEKHTKDVKNNKDGKHRPRKSSYDSTYCQFHEQNSNSYDSTYCQFHEQNSNSYDMLKTNVPNNLVSNLASRNINGSGNMFGRSNGPADENRISSHISIAEQLGDSDDDYTSASEDMMNYSVKMRNKFIRNEGQEMDDTCNHPDAIGYYASNGQSSQLDVFNVAPKEDLLVNMFSADETHPVVISSYRQKADMAERNGADKKQACSDIQAGTAHVQQMFKDTFSGSRSCFGQGDTSSKKGFTQWYVDDSGEKKIPVQRRAPAMSETNKYTHRGEEGHEEMCQDDLDLEDDEDVDEYDDEDAGVDEEDDDAGEDEEDEDDVEDDEGAESDESNLERELTHVIGDAPNGDCHKKEENHEIVDSRHFKGEAKNKTDSLEQRAAQNKSYNQSKYKCFDSKTGRINLKNHNHGHRYSSSSRVKHTSGYQKFSLDQIKVPTIEKERVRFACDENGDWAEIGRGSYGCVYLGLLDGIIEVAIKDFYESSSWDLVIHEARMLMFLQDTGITPKFYGLRRRFDVSKQPSEYCIIMEYFGDGRTLFNVMSDKIALTRDAWLDIVGQLVAGLRLIHRKNILINDLKADNILIDLTGGRKIIRYIDVGMATYKQGLTFQLPQDQMSRYNFLAPEVREGARTTTRSDVYSLGYMMEQMCRLADAALGGLKKLVTRCTDKNPSRRPDIDEIVSQVHRFIASKACAPSVASNPQEQFLLTNSV